MKFGICLLIGVGLLPLAAEPTRPKDGPSRVAERILKAQEEEKLRAAEQELKPEESKSEPVSQNSESGNSAEAPPSARARNPAVFRIPGADAWSVASQAGWKFFPRGAAGPRNGESTTAQRHPGLNTSLVQGSRMTQLRTPAGWNLLSENVFLMFADAQGQPKTFAPGWRLREVELRGTNWEWVSPPRAGAVSPFFAVKITGLKRTIDSVVEIDSISIEGPNGARDWRAAFVAP
ncbi:MAG: hypothetical protein ACR2OZ_17255 [Verrucomicrobiales bacterium]